jgi:hypothetical protein
VRALENVSPAHTLKSAVDRLEYGPCGFARTYFGVELEDSAVLSELEDHD